MKTLKATILLLATITFFIACDSDDNETVPRLNVQNLITTVNENLNSGETVGTVQAASSEGTISFSIENQSPANALSINPSTGKLTVANASLWDFETNPIIAATVSVLSTSDQQTAQVTINLEDMDDIAHLLSTSKTNYENAANGTWVQVTEAEYNSLASNLNEVSRIGTTEAEYTNSTATIRSSSIEFTVSNITTATVPSNSYVFAFKYNAFDVVNATTTKVKLSTTSGSDGYVDLGSALPSHSGAMEDIYFVLKGNITITSNLGYLAILKAENSRMGLKRIIGNQSYYWEIGDINSGLRQSDDFKILYQGLSTTQKQWD